MILQHFQIWARTAPVHGRADGIGALARAYLYSDLGAEKSHALRIMTEFLDDPSPLVRRALAEALADADDAPHHLVLALADDQSDVAAVVLARSPILGDAELIDCAIGARAAAQTAIASRLFVTAAVAGVLAEVAAPAALIALVANPNAALPELSIRRMVERHGDHAALREALLVRAELPVAIRVDLVAATTRALAAFVTDRNWISADRMKRVAVEARDKAAITIAGARRDRQLDLVAHLRRCGQLTVGLAFRAVLSGRLELFKAILSELAGVPLLRVDGLTRHSSSTGFAALCRKAGLPHELLTAFRVALQAAQTSDWHHGASLSRSAIERVLTACETSTSGELDKLMVMLRRFEAEAARDEARHVAAAAIAPETADRVGPLVLRPTDRAAREPAYTIDLAAIEVELRAA